MKPLRIPRRARNRPNTRISRQSRLPRNSAIHAIGVIDSHMLAAGSVLIGDSEAFNGVMVRMGTPEEIAYGVVFLTSDESSYMTGTELIIDGGKFDLTGDCTDYSLSFQKSDRPSIVIVPRPPVAS